MGRRAHGLGRVGWLVSPPEGGPLPRPVGVFEQGHEAPPLYLLGNGDKDYLPPVESVEQAFQAVSDHEQAIPKALVQAFREFMDQFAPEELRQQFDHYLKRNRVLGIANKLKYWQLYEETFSELIRGDEGTLPEAFSQGFARAYKEEVAALKSSRNK
jgi:type VI secretion system protein